MTNHNEASHSYSANQVEQTCPGSREFSRGFHRSHASSEVFLSSSLYRTTVEKALYSLNSAAILVAFLVSLSTEFSLCLTSSIPLRMGYFAGFDFVEGTSFLW